MTDDKFTGTQVPGVNRAELLRQLYRLLDWHELTVVHVRGLVKALELPLSWMPEGPIPQGQTEQDMQVLEAQPEPQQAEANDKPAKLIRRERTAAILAGYSLTVPGPKVSEGGILLRHGYLKKSGAGWVRTRKVFDVNG